VREDDDQFNGLFVKNLENVQGDERDAIFVSVAYAPDADGKFAMRFGPVSAEGGERRLNVLITRAKKRCVVFSGIGADDIDLDRASGRGVAALRAESESQGVPLVVVLFPVRHQVEARPLRAEPQQAFAAGMNRMGLRHADPLDALRSTFTADPASLFYDHCHYTPRGNEIVAEPIAEVVQRELALP